MFCGIFAGNIGIAGRLNRLDMCSFVVIGGCFVVVALEKVYTLCSRLFIQ